VRQLPSAAVKEGQSPVLQAVGQPLQGLAGHDRLAVVLPVPVKDLGYFA
jgi:hypothetical protein